MDRIYFELISAAAETVDSAQWIVRNQNYQPSNTAVTVEDAEQLHEEITLLNIKLRECIRRQLNQVTPR